MEKYLQHYAEFDLHCHSRYSDGVLSPADLVTLAYQSGVRVLALTDHDTTAGIPEALTTALSLGMTSIPGVEISSKWHDYEIHIVALRINTDCKLLQDGL